MLLGALIFLPALRSPFFLDDFLQGAMVEGSFPGQRGPFDLYDFIGDDNRSTLLDQGLLPWWTDKHLTVRFFRPISSALLFFEHRAFAHAALPMHLHSFCWWIAAALAARALFRRTLPQRPARIATFIFALAPCHILPLAWLANRATLLALALGTFGLVAYARWRDERRVRDALLAGALFTLAVLGGGEYALAFGGYVVAMEAMRRGDTLARRVVGVAPFIVPIAGYLAVRGRLGYGTSGSGFYSDPLRDMPTFLANAPMRAASLLGAGWLTFDVAWWRSGTLAEVFLVLVLVGSAAVLVPLVRRTHASLSISTRRAASWLALGSLLALLPALSAAPAARMLGAAMLGIAATVALVIDRAWFPSTDVESTPPRPIDRFASLLAVALAFAHLVHGPGTAWLGARAQRQSAMDFATRVRTIREARRSTTTGDIGIVRGLASAYFMPFALDPRGERPRWFVLSQAGHVLALRRDERTVDLVGPVGGSLYPSGDRNLYRSSRPALRKGDKIHVAGVTVTILETNEQGPRIARFVFDEDPEALVWVADDYKNMQKAALPPVGFGEMFDPRSKTPR